MKSPLKKIRDAYNSRMVLSEDDLPVVDYVVALQTAVVCNDYMVEPAWGYVIGPPSGGKTETSSTLHGYEKSIFIDEFTENCLASGSRDEKSEADPSLLPYLDGKLLVFGDLTSVMVSRPQVVDKIMGTLRRAYDQRFSKASGKQGVTDYHAAFGVCAACTDILDKFHEHHSQLGERFLSIRMSRVELTHPERVAEARKVYKTMKGKKKWRQELAGEVQEYIEQIRSIGMQKNDYPEMDEATEIQVVTIADLLSLLRTAPVDETASTPEKPYRIMQQTINLGAARVIADCRNKWEEQDLHFLRRVVFDTLSAKQKRLLWSFYSRGRHQPGQPITQLAARCHSKPEALIGTLTQWMYTGIIYARDMNAGEPLYALSPVIYESIGNTKLLEGKHVAKRRIKPGYDGTE